MANNKINGLTITGRLKKSGITIYFRNGKSVARTATSLQPKRRTRKQFIARQQMLHSTQLWGFLKWAGTPMFPALPTAYARFLSLMHRTEVVFLPQNGRLDGATMLLPDIPLSEGSLPTVKQHLGEVKGSPALVTNLTRDNLRRGDKLILYTLTQDITAKPKVYFKRREVVPDEMTETADGLALIGDEFADDMKGWALIHTPGALFNPDGRHPLRLLQTIHHRRGPAGSRRQLRGPDKRSLAAKPYGLTAGQTQQPFQR